MQRFAALLLTLLLYSGASWAQGTGNTFPTPSGVVAPGVAILVPNGPITNGQPSVAPPGPNNGLSVTCTNCSPSAPVGSSSNPVNGTVAVTNTFQLLLAQNNNRHGCIFQNQSTRTMYFSVSGSPTLANSLQVPGGSYFYCSGPSNIVITDAIQITGTATDAFAGQWQ